jgi:tetratricopeptide (TPR) repeat protein
MDAAVKRMLVVLAALAAVAVGAALASQAARDREYRRLLAQGDAALRDDQTFSAIEAYSGAVYLRPDSMLAHLRRGETYQRRGNLDAAARDFRRAGALDPTAARPVEELGDVLYQLQRYDRAADAYDRYLRLDDRSARIRYKLALARYRTGECDAAMAALRQGIGRNDRVADAQYLVGLCARRLQRDAEAQRALERAVALAPALIPAREELADLYAAHGRYNDQIEQLQVIAGLDRDHVERQVAVGLAYARAGHPDLAVLTLGSALERTPDQPPIYAALGQVWLDIAEREPHRRDALGKALQALERAASTRGVASDVLTLYGRALLLDRENDAAERTLQRAIARYPIEPAALLFYATAAERDHHLEAARQALVSYGALVSDDAAFGARAARIAFLSVGLDDPATAVAWLRRAVLADPQDVNLLLQLADAQIRAEDRDGARATIARVLERDPKNAALPRLVRRAR